MFYNCKPIVIDILTHACAFHEVGLRGEQQAGASLISSAQFPLLSCQFAAHATGRSVCFLRFSATRHRQPLSFANLMADREYFSYCIFLITESFLASYMT